MKTSSTLFSQANPGDLVTPFEDQSVIVFVISEDRDDDSSENCGFVIAITEEPDAIDAFFEVLWAKDVCHSLPPDD
jgi:hypothetical protein